MLNQKILKIYIDTPKKTRHFSKLSTVTGWVVPKQGNIIESVRFTIGEKSFDANYGMEKPGVLRIYPSLGIQALNSGFTGKVLLAEGNNVLNILAVINGHEEHIHELNIYYALENALEDYKIEGLSENNAEHKLLVDNKETYFHEAQSSLRYSHDTGDPRLVAFYLPQFHPTELNDKAWGKGFTEWNNVAAASPRFVGHEQPKLPGQLGFYDLRIDENIKNQIDLAKKHGIHGFCFYYYWFSGEKTLDLPLNTLIRHKEWDFNFMICWANENWTKRWDGRDDDIIVAQKYLKEDPLNFIKDVEHLLLDERYIKNNNKPLIAIYRGSELRDPKKYTDTWRDYFKKQHGTELEIVTMLNFDQEDPRPNGFDGGIEFEPMTTTKHLLNTKEHKPLNCYANLSRLKLDSYTGNIIPYVDVVHKSNLFRGRYSFPTYKSVVPSWDNDPRKKGAGTVFYGSNPTLYGHWLDKTIAHEIDKKSPLIFINAWNEWAEGAILEPNNIYGNAFLNKTTQVLSKYSKNKINQKNFPYGIRRSNGTKLAIIVHAYYLDQLGFITDRLKLISEKFDLIISTRPAYVKKLKILYPKAVIYGVPNRGRDMLPFLILGRQVMDSGYEYVLKLHSKKSTHRVNNDGNIWFESLVEELIPDNVTVTEITTVLDSQKEVFVGPERHFISLKAYMSVNSDFVYKILEDIDFNMNNFNNNYGYFAGSMFWANKEALKKIIDRGFIPEDFPSETGQLDGTLAHALERAISIPAQDKGSVYLISKDGLKQANRKNARVDYEYARVSYAKDNYNLAPQQETKEQELDRLKNELSAITNTKTYKTIHVLSKVKNKLKYVFKKTKNIIS